MHARVQQLFVSCSVLVFAVCIGVTTPSPLGAAMVQCPDGTPPPCRGAARTGPPPNSVAVLYFDNLSRDSSDAYLAEGLTEQTIASLAAVERLTVTSRFAVRRFRGRELPEAAALGRLLNVSYLVTGSVQRSGNRLRVGVELLRAATGVRVWGERFDRGDGDLLRLQDDVATAVATGIVGRLLPGERRELSARRTRNPAAYDRYLRGNFDLTRRDPAALQRAIREYETAIETDPGFADPIARIAYVHAVALDIEWDIGLPRDTMVQRGVAMADRALRLDSMSAEAWLAAAYIRMAEEPRTFSDVRRRFERALALGPGNAEVHHQFAQYLAYTGDSAGAEATNRRALALEPGRAVTWHQLAILAAKLGRWQEAIAGADSVLAADPGFALGHVARIMGYLGLGDTAAARQSARTMQAGTMAAAGHLFEASLLSPGESAGAVEERFRRLGVFAEPAPTQPGNSIVSAFAAMLLVRAGAREAALDLLEGARPAGVRLHDLLRWTFFEPIRNEPRFQRLWNASRPRVAP
jgi:TolB-like protein